MLYASCSLRVCTLNVRIVASGYHGRHCNYGRAHFMWESSGLISESFGTLAISVATTGRVLSTMVSMPDILSWVVITRAIPKFRRNQACLSPLQYSLHTFLTFCCHSSISVTFTVAFWFLLPFYASLGPLQARTCENASSEPQVLLLTPLCPLNFVPCHLLSARSDPPT